MCFWDSLLVALTPPIFTSGTDPSKIQNGRQMYVIYGLAAKWYISTSEKGRSKIKADLEMLPQNLGSVRGSFMPLL